MQKYSEIGGKSPIFEWTERQGSLVVQQLDQVSPETAPHHFYVGFRYANPLTEDALAQIERCVMIVGNILLITLIQQGWR